ncbi:acyl-CoA thioesterase [Arthrobacter castelli]|uniref:acyl-CoA thioesterase n=1 Tax=Arthrobacter castelli TaxID=271431 RepID=UPI000427912C|nr:thioesterase family protein [Arthrobacter castelli]
MTDTANPVDACQHLDCEVATRWGDMDAYGHINNVEIVRLLEEGRIAAFGPPGGTGRPGQEPRIPFFSDLPVGTQALVVEHRIKYLASVEYRNMPLKVHVWISALKAASLTINYQIVDPVTGTHCVKAQTAIAFVSADSGSLVRITPDQKKLVAPYVGEPIFG